MMGEFLGSARGLILAGLVFVFLIYLSFGAYLAIGFFFLFVLIGLYDLAYMKVTGKTLSRRLYERYRNDPWLFNLLYFLLMTVFVLTLYLHFTHVR